MAGRSATVPRRPYTRSASSGPLGRMSVTSTGSSIWTPIHRLAQRKEGDRSDDHRSCRNI
ncbi:Uncharacterised protein [Mycobacteroides abscessus subsp. abscessus]|nr:Uncharacterised protein [Mycobacteroides abscessus subsp. abscessus]